MSPSTGRFVKEWLLPAAQNPASALSTRQGLALARWASWLLLPCLALPQSSQFRLNLPCCFALPSAPAAEGSFLQQFLAATQGLGPAERGAYLEHPPEGGPDIDSIHEVGVTLLVNAAGRGSLPGRAVQGRTRRRLLRDAAVEGEGPGALTPRPCPLEFECMPFQPAARLLGPLPPPVHP